MRSILIAIVCPAMSRHSLTLATLLSLVAVAPADELQAAPAPQVQTQRLSLAEAVYDAGEIRTQAQRLAKLWLQAQLPHQPVRAQRRLAAERLRVSVLVAGLGRYEQHLAGGAGLQEISRVGAQWARVQQALDATGGAAAALQLADEAEALSLAAGRLAMQFEQRAPTGSVRLLDLALRQSMLVQRLARLQLLAELLPERASGGLSSDLQQTQREFAAALHELEQAPENTATSREALALARQQWLFFQQATQAQAAGAPRNLAQIATTSERLQETLTTAALQYAGQA